MSDWNFAEIWEAAAAALPDEPAVVQGEHRTTWKEFDRRASNLAHWLVEAGTSRQDKIALYLYNCPEYLEGLYGSMRVALVPVNTNYRYAEGELRYLWDNSDAVAVIFHGTFTERIDGLRGDLPAIRSWLWVDDGSGPCPGWATPYEEVVAGDLRTPRPSWGRSGDDLLMLYTGGTTGMPKGVMWRQDDLFARLNAAGFRRYPLDEGIEGIRQHLTEHGRGGTLLPSCPLMHGTGCFTAIECLSEGGTVVLAPTRSFDAEALLDAVERERVAALVIVGDSFARPLLEALERSPGRWDLASLVAIISSGAMWSEEVKQGLLRHHPGMLLVDTFSSSEALGIGTSVSAAGSARHTAEFSLGPEVRVLTPDGRQVEPGSGEVGVLALGGRNPVGYYKDEAKSASTFQVVDGVRYSVPGDFAEVKADGSIHLLGRGSVVINTAGEKVFPEEVEEVLKTHPAVRDAVVVGVPHQRFGEQIVGVVEVEGPASEQELIEHVKGELAGYKAPRMVRFVDTIGRSPSGKVDYGRHRDEATDWSTVRIP